MTAEELVEAISDLADQHGDQVWSYRVDWAKSWDRLAVHHGTRRIVVGVHALTREIEGR
jgi:hypothetical protein